MSIELISNKLREILQANYATKLSLKDVQTLSNNPEFVIKNGFGVVIGPNSASRTLKNAAYVNDRTFGIVLTKQIVEASNRNSNRIEKENEILAESTTIISKVKNDSALAALITNVDLVGDSGIEYFSVGELGYLSLRVDFEIKYVENY